MFKCNYLLASSLVSVTLCSVSATAVLADTSRGWPTDKPAPTGELQVPAEAQAATPTAANPAIVGLVKSYQGGNLLLRLSDGSDRTYQISPTVTPSAEIASGSFVSLDIDPQGQVKTLETTEVDKVYTGTVSKIEEDKVTLDLEDGGTYTTLISPATVTRMGLESGSPLKVTTYKGTEATRLCLGQKAVPIAAPEPVAPPPEPVGGGELVPPPALPPQPRALW